MSGLALSRSSQLQTEREQLVREAISRLPKPYRAVIEGLFLEDPPLPHQVLAERLGMTPGSLGFLRERGLRKLARIFAEIESGQDPSDTAGGTAAITDTGGLTKYD